MSTHDFTSPAWGHDIWHESKDGGLTLHAGGWGANISEGDFLVLRHPGGGTTRYRVTSIRYEANPHDQWFASMEFAPRLKLKETTP